MIVRGLQRIQEPEAAVTQQSDTFNAWETAHFLISNLSDSFKYSSEYIPQIIEEMVKREPEDMVIFPVYLNMLSLLWKCRDGTDLGVWQGTMDAILKSLEHQHRVPNDPDALSARKRALTLLITACSKHAANLIPFGEIFVQQLERLLMVPTTSRVERTLLYEAIAAFTAALPTNEAQQRLQKFLDPMAKIMIERVTPMNQNDFNDVIIGRTPAQRDEGYFIHDSLNVVAGVLRRCKAVPYVIETATLLAPAIMRLMKLSHGIYPGDLPPEYASILDPAVDSTQFRPTGGWRRGKAAGPRPEVTRARNILMDIRSTLYQVIGMLSSLYPAEPLQDMMQVLVSTAQALSIHTMKQLLLHCVIPVATTQGELLPVALSLCNTFFQHRSLITADRPEGEARDNRQLFYLSKDILAFIKQNLADNGKLDGNLALSRSVLDVALSILQSGTNISETSHLVTSILSSYRLNGLEGAENTDMLNVARYAYERMLNIAVHAENNILAHKDREKLLATLADAYLSQYPLYVPVLKEHYSQSQVDELNTHLTMRGRVDMKRRFFKEFLQQSPGGARVGGVQTNTR